MAKQKGKHKRDTALGRHERSSGIPVGLGPDDVAPAENRAMIEAQNGAVSPKAHRAKAQMPRKQITLDDCLAGCEKLKPLHQAEDSIYPRPETKRERWNRKLSEAGLKRVAREREAADDAANKARAERILEDLDG